MREATVDLIEGRHKFGFRVRGNRRDNDIPPVRRDLQRRIHRYIQQLEYWLVENEGGTIAMLDQFLSHSEMVNTMCIQVNINSREWTGYYLFSKRAF